MKLAVISAVLAVSCLAYVAEGYSVAGGLGFSGPALRVPASSAISRITALTPPLRSSPSASSLNSFHVGLSFICNAKSLNIYPDMWRFDTYAMVVRVQKNAYAFGGRQQFVSGIFMAGKFFSAVQCERKFSNISRCSCHWIRGNLS
jgi:hypothetical protein